MGRPVSWLVVIALVALAPHAASADDKAQASTVFSEAKAKYGAGDYAAAAKLFVHAYELDPDPAYLFNVAQAFRLAGDCVNAAEYYQQFLGKVPNPPNLDDIKGWLADAQKCSKERAPKKVTPPPPREVVAPPTPTHHEPTPVVPIIAIGGGVVALAIAGFFTWDASYLAGQKDQLVDECNLNHCNGTTVLGNGKTLKVTFDDYDHRGKRAQILAVSGFAVGGLAIAVGIWQWRSHSKSERPIALAPVRGGAVVATAFSF